MKNGAKGRVTFLMKEARASLLLNSDFNRFYSATILLSKRRGTCQQKTRSIKIYFCPNLATA
jgi:hypothetical protein